MAAPSLVALCTKACIRNVSSLRDVGDFEYVQIRPVLERLTNPDQLREIELNSPQIKGEDAQLWKDFIARDIGDWKKKNYVPKNPEKWYQVYQKYKREQKEEIEEDKQRLKEAMLGLKKEKESHVSKKVDPRLLPKLPRDPRMMANDGGVPIGGRKRGLAKPAAITFNWSGGSKTKTNTSAGVLNRARREAKELSARNKLIKPTSELLRQRVRQAPKGLVEEYQRAAAPSVHIFTTKRKAVAASHHNRAVSGRSLADREAQLRTLAKPKHGAPEVDQVIIVGSDSEDEPSDDLFDYRSSVEPAPAPKRHSYEVQETRHRPSPASARLPQPSSTPQHTSLPKPSDIINSLISKPQQRSEHYGLPRSTPGQSPPRSLASSSHRTDISSPLRVPSPTPGQPRLMGPKRKVTVDIFNRSGAASKKIRRS